MKKILIFSFLVAVLIFGSFSCKNYSSANPVGEYLGRSECDNLFPALRTDQTGRLAQGAANEIVIWSYQDRTLTIDHINAGFNCCPQVRADIEIGDDSIVITEFEDKGDCHCLCLYTLKYQITDLSIGNYEIKIKSPYIPADAPPIVLNLNIQEHAQGQSMFVRDVYPWK